jgi:hypothetical protein
MAGGSMKNGFTINQYGTKEWWSNDKRHREDGPAIEYVNGSKFWYLNDKRHREDGPAVEFADGDKYWYLNDKLHREDGPAIECASGSKEWYLNGKKLSFIPKYVLLNYMKAKSLTLAHLLTDSDPLVRESTMKYKWKEVA